MLKDKFYLYVTGIHIAWGYQQPGNDDEKWDYFIDRKYGDYNAIITHSNGAKERYQSGHCGQR